MKMEHRALNGRVRLATLEDADEIFVDVPFTKLGELSSPYFLEISIASFIATLYGVSV